MKKFFQLIVEQITVLIICAILCISTISIFTITQRILPQIHHLVQDQVNTQVSDINLWFQFNREIIRQYANTFRDESLTEENHLHILELLREYQQDTNIRYESLGFITLEGEKFLTDDSDFTVNDRAYFLELTNTNKDVVISDVITSKSNQEKIVLIVAKVFDENQQVIGYISAALRTDYIENLMMNIAKEFNVYIANLEGDVVMGNPTDVQGIHFEKDINTNPNWKYVLEIPYSYYMNTILETVLLISVVTVVILLVAQYIVRQIAYGLVTPLKNLENVMANAKDGELLKSEEHSHIQEFETLNASYNAMVDEINHLITEVKEKEHERSEADNRALYSQIKPHFLYNTLETIQAMAFDHDDEDVENAIHDLAVFFRTGLSDNRQMVSLDEEIMHVRSYLKIQKLRYHAILNDEWEIDHDLLQNQFLKFTIQPLVENAIYHGVKVLNQPSTIQVHIYAQDETIVVDVINRYETIDENHIAKINEELKKGVLPEENLGYGLFNVNARIQHQYGNRFGVQLIAENHVFTSRMIQPKSVI